MPYLFYLSECRDSNPESLVPKTRMLAVTPHSELFNLNWNKSILAYFLFIIKLIDTNLT